MAYLWKVTAKRKLSSEVASGMSVEIVKKGTNAKPTNKEIANAFNEKYNINLANCHCGSSNFDIESLS